ncbi:HlyD family secretion protein [Larkinella soli]|uniref:HlyD family secretion protein n=1 Tax=Larkinella soli TaxID=1770527 RepID=UPI000FFBF314|nr:HlyD family efflux transporter periplasmic adaptor subunit [Larkinella soli]
MNTVLKDLTEAQYADLYHVDDAPLPDLRLKALQRLGWWAVLLVAAGFAAGFLIVLPDTIPTGFVFKSEQAEAVFRFPAPVYIERQMVRNGQTVKAGDDLLELSSPDIAALAHDLEAARSNLDRFRRFRTASAASEQDGIRLTIRRIRETLALKESRRVMVETKWASESKRLEYEREEAGRLLKLNRDLFTQSVISRNDLHQFEAAALKTQSAFDLAYQTYLDQRSTLTREITSGKLEINTLETQITKNTGDLLGEENRLEAALRTARIRIESLYGPFELTGHHHLRLKAARAGTVSFLFEGEKQVPAGTTLLKLMHREAPLYGHARVTSSQIGKIRAGQRVVLKVDAYPVYEFGPVYGDISAVSLTPDEKGLFNVRLRVTHENALENRLRIGLRGQADIITDERTIFGHLTRSFRKAASDLTD